MPPEAEMSIFTHSMAGRAQVTPCPTVARDGIPVSASVGTKPTEWSELMPIVRRRHGRPVGNGARRVLIAVRIRLLPAWLGGTGIMIAIAVFAPGGFFASCAAGAWITVISAVLYLRGATTPAPSAPGPAAGHHAPIEPGRS
jgi:hypothetical protein